MGATDPARDAQRSQPGQEGPSVMEDGAGHAFATAHFAAANPVQPWNIASAAANETVGFLKDRFHGSETKAPPDQWQAGAGRAANEHTAGPVHHERIDQHLDPGDAANLCAHPDIESQQPQEGKLAGNKVQSSLLGASPKDADAHKQRLIEDAATLLNGDAGRAEGNAFDPGRPSDRDDSSMSESTEDPEASHSALDMQEMDGAGGHYNPQRDVLLRLEFLTSGQSRFVVLFMWSALFVAMIFLWVEFALKIADPNGVTRSRDTQIMNLAVGAVSLIVMSVSIWRFVTRVTLAHIHKLVWKPRRLRSTALTHFELFVQYVNIATYIAANGNSLTSYCRFFSKAIPWTQLVEWTCWNMIFLLHTVSARNVNVWRRRGTGSTLRDGTTLKDKLSTKHDPLTPPGTTHQHDSPDDKARNLREPALYLEAPIWVHWPLGILWIVAECAVVANCIFYATGSGSSSIQIYRPANVAEGDCKHYIYNCSITNVQMGLVGLMLFFPVLYFFIFCLYLRRAFAALSNEPYSDFKVGNLLIRLMVRLRLGVFAFFILSIVLLYFIKYNSCRVYADTWLGLTPLHIAESASVVCWSFVAMPKNPVGEPPLLQVWLQEFAWTEKELPKLLARRNAAQSSGGHEQEHVQHLRTKLERQPMFCFQTAMHMWYWSALVYDYKQADKSVLSLEEAMSFYGLTSSELFWEKASDTKMLMAWNRNTVVVAFRGTASINNAWSDLQAYPTLHLPKRGNLLQRPKVHTGFQKCWTRNAFHETVKARIIEMLNSGELERGNVKFYVTGHSLGGALATLAAFSFAQGAIENGHEDYKTGQCLPLACYTFGAPRTGNHTFAKEYEHLVPDTWHIINDQDAVPRSGKFMGLFKRGGQRVIINRRGDMIVRPLTIEASLQQVPGGLSVSQHLLAAYTVSLMAVMMGQFSNKRFKGGMAGVVRLAEQSTLVQRMIEERMGWSLEDMRHMQRWGPSHARKIRAHLFRAGTCKDGPGGMERLRATLSGFLKMGSSKDSKSAPTDEEQGKAFKSRDQPDSLALPSTFIDAADERHGQQYRVPT
ncbi:hypothetical protein WJX73_007832 [Symbiochloris irregularis]|uniref:Fungal lipase-type domain-containing protein n=1 Tax=Symbiochloris irregularis TaxID=706552 RepID=A0AAW1PH00_9CHLO